MPEPAAPRWERWLLPGVLAAVGVPFGVAGGAIALLVPHLSSGSRQSRCASTSSTIEDLYGKVFCGLTAYCHQPKQPSLNLDFALPPSV